MKKQLLSVMIIVLSLVLGACTDPGLESRIATLERRVKTLQTQVETLKDQNVILENRVSAVMDASVQLMLILDGQGLLYDDYSGPSPFDLHIVGDQWEFIGR